MSTSKIGVIGDRDSILGFGILGVTPFVAENPREAEEALRKAAGEGYACIFLTEELAADMGEILDEYRGRPDLAILLIPGNTGRVGLGTSMLREAVEKAVGKDIIFQERG